MTLLAWQDIVILQHYASFHLSQIKCTFYKHLCLKADKGLDRNILSMFEPILGINRGVKIEAALMCTKSFVQKLIS